MQGSASSQPPPPLPPAVDDLVRRLESLDHAVWQQGEALLATPEADDPASLVLLCAAEPEGLLSRLPRAVVTASHGRRLRLRAGDADVELIPLGDEPLADALARFGLGALAFAWRPSRGEWCDPSGVRAGLARGELDVVLDPSGVNPFERAPRRYWLAARLLAQASLQPTPALLEAARQALPAALDRIPRGAPARRPLEATLRASRPAAGLRFLASVGVCEALLPGIRHEAPEIVDALPMDPGLRLAAWLDGAALPAASRLLQLPPARAQRIERLQQLQPIERSRAVASEAGLARTLQRLGDRGLEGLIDWRLAQLAAGVGPGDESSGRAALDALRERIRRHAARRAESERIQSLALGGRRVMEVLGRGPGPHVGRALAHLGALVAEDPSVNTVARLERALGAWASAHLDPPT